MTTRTINPKVELSHEFATTLSQLEIPNLNRACVVASVSSAGGMCTCALMMFVQLQVCLSPVDQRKAADAIVQENRRKALEEARLREEEAERLRLQQEKLAAEQEQQELLLAC